MSLPIYIYPNFLSHTLSLSLQTMLHQQNPHHHNHNHQLNKTMQQLENKPGVTTTNKEKRPKFCINDHIDILIEILKRVDGRSLGVAACVCRLWCTITRNDSLWEDLCFRHVSPSPAMTVRPVVVALGGYKKLYMGCVRPVLSRLGRARLGHDSDRVRRVWTRDEVQLSLSLFCVDYYERLGGVGGGGGGGGGGRFSGDASASSLMFLCKPVNV